MSMARSAEAFESYILAVSLADEPTTKELGLQIAWDTRLSLNQRAALGVVVSAHRLILRHLEPFRTLANAEMKA